MKIIIKAIILQLFWFLIAWAGPQGYWYLLMPASYLILIIDYQYFPPAISKSNYFFMATIFGLIGLILDYTLYYYKLITFRPNGFEIWQLSMWIIFISYYQDIFKPFYKNLKLTLLIGAIAGPMAYLGVDKIGGITIHNQIVTYSVLALFWGLFLVISLKIYQLISLKKPS